jgi:hypothetical protein
LSRTLDNRQLHGSRGLRAFGLFVAVWLNLALAPCAMAYEAARDHDCPDCPPAESHAHHDMHDAPEATASMPCADELSDCMIEDDAANDGRQGQLKTGDDHPTFVVPFAGQPTVLSQPVTTVAVPRYASIHPGAPPPIHLLNCVFLD